MKLSYRYLEQISRAPILDIRQICGSTTDILAEYTSVSHSDYQIICLYTSKSRLNIIKVLIKLKSRIFGTCISNCQLLIWFVLQTVNFRVCYKQLKLAIFQRDSCKRAWATIIFHYCRIINVRISQT